MPAMAHPMVYAIANVFMDYVVGHAMINVYDR